VREHTFQVPRGPGRRFRARASVRSGRASAGAGTG